jgi:all-trans-retinol 13,14-reductase
MRIAIIGSGMAGLTAGAALAGTGHTVTVFEQADHTGGVTAPFEQDGFRWDLGQLLLEGLGRDELVGRILRELRVLDRIQVRKDDRGYVFPDFEIRKPETYRGLLWRMDRLKEMFPGEARGLDRYWRDYLRFTRIMTCARKMETSQGWHARLSQALLYANLLPFWPRKDWSAVRLMDSYFKSEKLKMIFISILADFFTPPSHFPGLGVFALNPEASFEHRMPKTIAAGAEQLYHYSVLGGVSTLADALAARIRECGGEILTRCPVSRIVVENGRVTGLIDASGSFNPADVIIASGGAKEVFFNLVGKNNLPSGFASSVENLPLMDSVFMVHLGLEMNPLPYVHGVCTYYYGTYDLEGGIEKAKHGIYHEGEDGFVVHVPTLHSPLMAPTRLHAMTIYTICPDRLNQAEWEDRKERYADQLVAFAEKRIPGLREHICTRAILTPDDFRVRTHTNHHAFGGTAPIMGAAKISHQTPVEGLWFIGAQSESGGGINNVIPGAYRVAKKVGSGKPAS